jgi:hypothetical protein
MRVSSALLLAILLCAGCQTITQHTPYDPIGYKPKNPSNVIIKVSLQNRMVYVMEGNRPLLVTATAIGTPSNPTPKGRFRVTRKIENKRSNTYGFWVKGETIIAGKSSQPPGSGYRYVGFPMQYWVEWMPAYGFTSGRCGPFHGLMAVCACTKTPLASFLNSPVLALRYTLLKSSPRTPLWAKILGGRKTTTILTHRRASSFLRKPLASTPTNI